MKLGRYGIMMSVEQKNAWNSGNWDQVDWDDAFLTYPIYSGNRDMMVDFEEISFADIVSAILGKDNIHVPSGLLEKIQDKKVRG